MTIQNHRESPTRKALIVALGALRAQGFDNTEHQEALLAIINLQACELTEPGCNYLTQLMDVAIYG